MDFTAAVNNLAAFQGSIAFLFLHAVHNAFHVRKTSTNTSVLRGVICTIILACGGGIITCITANLI